MKLVPWLRTAFLSLCTLGCSAKPDPRQARKERSPQWKDGQFVNPEPIQNHYGKMLSGWWNSSPTKSPPQPLPTVKVDPKLFLTPPASGLRLTWLGHSTAILEIDGHRFLLDPVWSDRSSPVQWAGPKRWYAPLFAVKNLPEIDAVLISHDHFDHLDRTLIDSLKDRNPRFVVPLGTGETLEESGVPAERIVELDWWETTRIGDLEITSTPARHASGRSLIQNRSLWMGFAIKGPVHKVYYSGDTGPMKQAAEIGTRLGPFDLTVLECGQYDPAWPDWHMTPEQTLALHKAVRGQALVPVHWGLFALANHSWDDPVNRLVAANADSKERILVPRPGQSIEPDSLTNLAPWWHSKI